MAQRPKHNKTWFLAGLVAILLAFALGIVGNALYGDGNGVGPEILHFTQMALLVGAVVAVTAGCILAILQRNASGPTR